MWKYCGLKHSQRNLKQKSADDLATEKKKTFCSTSLASPHDPFRKCETPPSILLISPLQLNKSTQDEV